MVADSMEPGCSDAVQQLCGFFFRHDLVGWCLWNEYKWPHTVGIMLILTYPPFAQEKTSKTSKKTKKPLIKRWPANSQSAGLNPISSLTPISTCVVKCQSLRKRIQTFSLDTYQRQVLWPRRTRVRYHRHREDFRRIVSLESRTDYEQFHWCKGKRLE